METNKIYTLSLHDALPILAKVRPSKKLVDVTVESVLKKLKEKSFAKSGDRSYVYGGAEAIGRPRSEEHTSELQSHSDLVCRLLLEKEKQVIVFTLKSARSL